jgi:hypothetical protein
MSTAIAALKIIHTKGFLFLPYFYRFFASLSYVREAKKLINFVSDLNEILVISYSYVVRSPLPSKFSTISIST